MGQTFFLTEESKSPSQDGSNDTSISLIGHKTQNCGDDVPFWGTVDYQIHG